MLSPLSTLSAVFSGGIFVVFVMLLQNMRTAFHCLELFELKTCVTPIKSTHHMNHQQFDNQVLADVFQLKEVAIVLQLRNFRFTIRKLCCHGSIKTLDEPHQHHICTHQIASTTAHDT